MALKLNEEYPGRFNNPTPDYPQGSFKNRTTPTSEDGSYFEQRWANDHLAFLSSLLNGAGIQADGSVDKVGASQYYDAFIAILSSRSKDYLNTLRVNVAASSSVDLSSVASATSNINITGSATISGFTVPAGKLYFVRFAGSVTISNNASIVTQSGGSIVTSGGDTCILRSTSANVVEVLCFTPGVPQEIGYRQSWKDLTSSRVPGTTYTNSSGRAITITIAVQGSPAADTVTLIVGGVTLYTGDPGIGTPSTSIMLTAIVPNNTTYSINLSAQANIIRWSELS